MENWGGSSLGLSMASGACSQQPNLAYLPFIFSISLWLFPHIGCHSPTLHTTYPSSLPQSRDTEQYVHD